MDGILSGLTNAKDTFENNYTIGELLGRGGFAEVKSCTEKKTRVVYAVKVFNKKTFDPETIPDLQNEVRILSRINHYAVLAVREAFESKSFIYLVTELLSGLELFDRIVDIGTYSERDASIAVKNMLDGIQYLHSQGIVHRDLKPENLIYNKAGDDAIIKIVDFGLAAEVTPKKLLNAVCGTPGYVAPEVVLGAWYGCEVDMWSLGVIIYIMLSGMEPFGAETEEEMYIRILDGRYHKNTEFWRSISANATNLVENLLLKDTKKRLTAAQALQHPWVQGRAASRVQMAASTLENLKAFNAKRKLKGGIRSVMALQRMKRMSIHPF